MVSTLDQRALTAPRTVCSAGSPREAGAAARQPADGRQHRLHDRETPAQRDELASICARHSRPQMDVLRTHTAIFISDPDLNVWPLCPAQGHRTRQCQRAGCVVRLRWPGCSIPRPFAYSLRNAALGRARSPADRRTAFGLAAPPRPSGRLPGCRPASDPRHPRPCEMACMTCT
jgi:hypothetical protein